MSGSDGEESHATATGGISTQHRLRKLEESVVLLNKCFQTGSPLLGSLRVVDAKPDSSPSGGRVSIQGFGSTSAAGDEEPS
eukprot:CAMPEP_0113832940 /NCGR_PEP_ID=MMETSP0328-20130328/7642_1 /TAXON_ID=39455 /ORGANISM="Alexandrium minutum" /LENGTH=80 /DNA_ID=CAMNT_0000801177 /DNA_START=32 /DNA_END=270 /DNA_ORIENTATION=- /assembly_acc=CAM_ASM_000350